MSGSNCWGFASRPATPRFSVKHCNPSPSSCIVQLEINDFRIDESQEPLSVSPHEEVLSIPVDGSTGDFRPNILLGADYGRCVSNLWFLGCCSAAELYRMYLSAVTPYANSVCCLPACGRLQSRHLDCCGEEFAGMTDFSARSFWLCLRPLFWWHCLCRPYPPHDDFTV